MAGDAGVLHLNVKPANILTGEGILNQVISDFGIAGITDHAINPARFERSYESLLYAAPEQLTSSSTVDERADVYGLGATLFHMMTGKPPYRDISADELRYPRHTLSAPTVHSRIRGNGTPVVESSPTQRALPQTAG